LWWEETPGFTDRQRTQPYRPSVYTRAGLSELGCLDPDERIVMSIVVRFHPTGMTRQQYDEADQKLRAAGEWPPDGMDYHVCFGQDGDLHVSEIWDSTEKLEAFGERLMPILSEVGIQPGEPEVYEVQNVERR